MPCIPKYLLNNEIIIIDNKGNIKIFKYIICFTIDLSTYTYFIYTIQHFNFCSYILPL